jgi:hypothetical protein
MQRVSTATRTEFRRGADNLLTEVPEFEVQNLATNCSKLVESIPARIGVVLKAKLAQEHISTEMCTVSDMLQLLCPAPGTY